ncbi:MAG: hypothetical protein L3J35_08785 [Bacteroidales bacterium]|nr:hypothetical protein [Bacteroidales bacterium]
MKTNLFKILSVFFALGLFALASCEKPDPDAQSAEDDARGSYIMADAFAVGNTEAGGTGKASLPACVDVYRNQTDTIVLTFNNCDYLGSVRSGSLIINYTRLDIGARAVNIIITFDNYTIDGIAVEGKITTTFGGTYIRPEINVVAENMSATFTDNKTISWSSDKTFTIVSGFGDGNISTNIIEMSGTASGINRQGKSYSSVYNKVRIERSCTAGYPVSGTVTIESDKGTSVIDYGNGTCDKTITVTNNGVTVEVTLN